MNKSIYNLFKDSENYKAKINSEIANRISIYNGDPYGNEVEGRSKIVWKLTKKQIKTLVANIVKQFTSGIGIVKLTPVSKNDVIKAKIDEGLINYFYENEIEKIHFNKRLALLVAKEGTAVVRVGWKKLTKLEPVDLKGINPASLPNGTKIEKDEDGKTYIRKVLKNKPTLEIIPNEDVYTDPLAYTFEQSRYIFIKKEVTKEELRENPLLDGEKVEAWINRLLENQDSNAGNDLHDRELWRIDKKEDNPKPIDEKVYLYEYWYKEKDKIKVKYLTFDGTEEVVFATKDVDVGSFPFIFFNLDVNEFSMWGDGLPDLIDDEQKFMTSIVRGVIDNMSQSNYGTKFVKKGALDSTNFNRLMSGETVVEVNTTAKLSDVMIDGNFNELPSSVYNMLQIIEQQAEGLTGISRAMQGVDADSLKSPASNYSAMMTQAQVRLYDFMQSFQEGWKKIFLKWLEMSMKYLDDDEIYDRTGISIPDVKWKEINRLKKKYQVEKLPQDVAQQVIMLIDKEIQDIFNKEDIKYDIRFRIGSDGLTQIKVSQLNMLLQQLIPAMQSGSIPGDILKKLLAKLAELMEFPQIADEIESYEPQPDPMQQQMMQLEMMEKQAKAEKEKALAQNAMARAQQVGVKTRIDASKVQMDLLDKASGVELKKAQADKTKAEAIATLHGTKKTLAEAHKIMKETKEILKGDKK